MIKHIVSWKFADEAEGRDRDANVRIAVEKLAACADIVPGIVGFEVVLPQPGLEATFDLMLVSEFTDAAALAAYAPHPTHQVAVKHIKASVVSRDCFDYDPEMLTT